MLAHCGRRFFGSDTGESLLRQAPKVKRNRLGSRRSLSEFQPFSSAELQPQETSSNTHAEAASGRLTCGCADVGDKAGNHGFQNGIKDGQQVRRRATARLQTPAERRIPARLRPTLALAVVVPHLRLKSEVVREPSFRASPGPPRRDRRSLCPNAAAVCRQAHRSRSLFWGARHLWPCVPRTNAWLSRTGRSLLSR